MSYLLSVLASARINSQNLVSMSELNNIPPISMKAMTKNTLIRLDETEIDLRMQTLTGWTTDGNSLYYTRRFGDFVEAIDFVNSLVAPAEALGHHPDITVNYNQVSLELTTHDAQGLTELDFQLAAQISQL